MGDTWLCDITSPWKKLSGTDSSENYTSIAWKKDGTRAIIVGNSHDGGQVYNYYGGNENAGKIPDYEDILSGHKLYGAAYHPITNMNEPVMLIGASAFQIRPNLIDQSTQLTVNAVVPKLWWIGLNETVANGLGSRLGTQVDTKADYLFTLRANYSEGWPRCQVVVEAWYDNGNVGFISPGSGYPIAMDGGSRNLAFSIIWNASDANAFVLFPNSPLMEITTGAVTETEIMYPYLASNPENHREVHIPIWFGNQIKAAPTNCYNGFGMDNSSVHITPFSWDFSISVRDATIIGGGSNTSYGEFGVKRQFSIMASGNPSGSAPPGSVNKAMLPFSRIIYSANADYYVNISIPNLYLNGNPDTLTQIFASNISVQNMHPDSNLTNSDISGQVHFTGPNTPYYIWGQSATPLFSMQNGTVSAGPSMSNYTDPLTAYTELRWWVDIDGGTPEGVYWGVITITIYL